MTMTSLLINSRKPDISFHANGKIDILARIAKLLSIVDGDVINIAKHNREYLLYVAHRKQDIVGAHDGTVHATKKCKKVSHNLRAYSKKLTTAMFSEVSAQSSPLRLAAGELVQIEGLGKAITLITRTPL